MTQQTDRNFVLTQPLNFEGPNFDGKAGDVCIWRAPGQLVVYRSGSLVANFKLSLISLLALKSEAIFSTGQLPRSVDPQTLPEVDAPEVVHRVEAVEEVVVTPPSPKEPAPVVTTTVEETLVTPTVITEESTTNIEETPVVEETFAPEETPVEETPVVEETLAPEEAPVEEAPVVEEAPAATEPTTPKAKAKKSK